MAIRSSLYLAVLLLLSHLIAAWAVYAVAVPMLFAVAMSLPVAASLAYHLARDAWLLLPASWLSLSVEDRVATVVARDGSVLSGQVAGSSVVTPWFVVLRIKPDGKRRPISRTIFPDALGEEAFRKLCIRLRYD
jgi:hypothetical protein